MGRTGKTQNRVRQSLSSSIVIEDADASISNQELSYSDFLKQFRGPDEPTVDLIGCKKDAEKIENKIKLFLKSSGPSFKLVSGPSGCGKSCIVRKLAENYSQSNQLSTFYLKASWTLNRRFSSPEARISNLFKEAVEQSPSLIVIEQIEDVCAEKRSEPERRILNTLLHEFEGLILRSERVLVVATTRTPDTLDSELTRACFFWDVVQFKLPGQNDRKDMFKHLLSERENNLTDDNINEIATKTHCYSFWDLSNLCEIASEICQLQNTLRLTSEHFKLALSQFKPAAIKKVTSPHALLRWCDIGGNELAKLELQKSIIWPLKHRDRYTKIGRDPRKGAFMYGPPGCSKTMLAQALATESGYNFIAVKGPELITKYVGDSEAAVRRLYRNAREIAPCIIFFDEIDGLATERSDNQSSSVSDRVVNTLLSELDGVEQLHDVYTIAATNRPHRLDNALLRPGRFHPAIYIPLPDEQDRREIFKVHLRRKSVQFDEPIDKIVETLAARTARYSGAEIAEICNVASDIVIEESLTGDSIAWRHLEAALGRVKPGTQVEDLKAYEQFQRRWRQNSTGQIQGTENKEPERKGSFRWVSRILKSKV